MASRRAPRAAARNTPPADPNPAPRPERELVGQKEIQGYPAVKLVDTADGSEKGGWKVPAQIRVDTGTEHVDADPGDIVYLLELPGRTPSLEVLPASVAGELYEIVEATPVAGRPVVLPGAWPFPPGSEARDSREPAREASPGAHAGEPAQGGNPPEQPGPANSFPTAIVEDIPQYEIGGGVPKILEIVGNVLRRVKKSWDRTPAAEQEAILADLDDAVSAVVRRIVDQAASRGWPYLPAKLEGFTIKDGIKATVKIPANHPRRHELLDRQGGAAILVIVDPEPWLKGPRPEPEPDQAALAIDTGGADGKKS